MRWLGLGWVSLGWLGLGWVGSVWLGCKEARSVGTDGGTGAQHPRQAVGMELGAPAQPRWLCGPHPSGAGIVLTRSRTCSCVNQRAAEDGRSLTVFSRCEGPAVLRRVQCQGGALPSRGRMVGAAPWLNLSCPRFPGNEVGRARGTGILWEERGIRMK